MTYKLLLADDSVTIQRVIELTFADEDVEVLTAGDGEQAIASIRAERPDIVLADIGMPKRSGYDVAAFIKGEPELAHIPVLLLTGAFEPVDEARARAAGCDGVLVKPFEPQHVIARVRELLKAGGRADPSVTRAVSDVPRPAERLAPNRAAPPTPAAQNGDSLEVRRPPHHAARNAGDSALDDYFDRLDAAFANISTPADAPAARPPEPAAHRDGPVMERDLDWFDSGLRAAAAEHRAPSEGEPPGERPRDRPSPSFERPDVIDVPPSPAIDPVPVTFASPPGTPARPLPQPPSIEPPDSPPQIAPQPAALPRPDRATAPEVDTRSSPIADAFSALLAAEQGEPDAAPVRLGGARPPAAATDALVDEVARRVIERLGAPVAQDLVADIVSRVAERLVREEMDRIRNKHS